MTLTDRIAARLVDLERTAACDPLYGPAAARDAALLRECCAEMAAAEERGRSEERAAIVAQIREYAATAAHPRHVAKYACDEGRRIASMIERAAPAESPDAGEGVDR